MATCLGKSCSFGLPRVTFVNCCQYIYLVVGFEGRVVSVPVHCLSFYFEGSTYAMKGQYCKRTQIYTESV